MHTAKTLNLHELRPLLSGNSAKAVDYLLSHPQDPAVQSMREVARRAGVQPVTLVRLAQRLGLAGWGELRALYVERLLDAQETNPATRNWASATAILSAVRDEPTAFAEAFFLGEQQVLDNTLAGLSGDHLCSAAETLASARQIFVTGRRTSFPAAFAMAYALRKMRPHVVLLDDAGGAPEAALDDATPEDVFVAITFAPFARVTDSLARSAARNGARIIAITDRVDAPLHKLADSLVFVTSTLSRAFPESAVGALALANLLSALTLARLGEAGRKRIYVNEERLVRSGEYVLAGPKRRK